MHICIYACMYAYLNYVTRDSGQTKGSISKQLWLSLGWGENGLFLYFLLNFYKC